MLCTQSADERIALKTVCRNFEQTKAMFRFLVLLGFVFEGNADFADNYIGEQLTEQRINFTAVECLSDEEKQSTCLVEYAGTPLDSGKKAEYHADDCIGFHLTNVADGETYATLRPLQTTTRTANNDEVTANATNVDALKADLDKVTGQRDTMFNGDKVVLTPSA